MQQLQRIFGLFLVVFVFMGCSKSSGKHVIVPGVSGVVLDSHSRLPIQNAVISVTPCYQISGVGTKTDSSGRFLLDAQYGFGNAFIPYFILPETATLSVTRDGYESAVIPFRSRSKKELGEISLVPISK